MNRSLLPIKLLGENRFGVGCACTGRFGAFGARAVTVQFAGRQSLIAFAAATLRGLLPAADVQAACSTALIAGAVFCSIGLTVGRRPRWLMVEHAGFKLANRKADHVEANS